MRVSSSGRRGMAESGGRHAAALHGLRVLDLCDASGQLAGRILADLGAEVWRVELAEPGFSADPTADPAGEEAQRIARNAGKRRLRLDLDRDVESLRALAREADVLLETFAPGELDRRGLGHARLSADNPGLVLCSITPYGQSGPWATRRGSDLTVTAVSGNLYMTGDPERAPVRCSMPVTHYHGGAEAAAAVLMALWERRRSGRGQHVDVSLQEAMLLTSMSHPAQAWGTGKRGRRAGAHSRVGDVVLQEIWRCADGWVSFALRGGPTRIPGLIALVDWMDEHGMAPPVLRERDWKAYNHNRVTQEEADAIAAPIAAFFRTRTMQELYDAALERRLMLAPANTEREILASRQLAARDFFAEIDLPRGGKARVPRSFARWPLAEMRGGVDAGRSPVARPAWSDRSTDRDATSESRSERAHSTHQSPAIREVEGPGVRGGEAARRRGIFDGLKILELGAGAAIPLATRYFADQGATVIKVESRHRPDFLRILTATRPDDVDGCAFFNVLNPNKRSAGLNLRHPRAPEVARRLIAWCDVVVENFAPGVMGRWGLDDARLRPEHPSLIMVSTCLLGQTGPERRYPGFGGQGSAIAGFNQLTGWPDREPLGPFGTITDSLSPRFVATAITAALLHRDRTGEGSFIDLSQVEVGVYCLSEWLLRHQMTGAPFARIGNRATEMVPHGVFPAREDDRWVAIAVHDDADWQRLRAAMGDPEWMHRPEWDHLDGRIAAIDAIEDGLARWTAGHERTSLTELLWAAGLDAAPVEDLQDLREDPQLVHRRHFRAVDHPVTGRHMVEANAIRFSRVEHDLSRPAPRLAADNQYVYEQLIGYSADERAELERDGVLI